MKFTSQLKLPGKSCVQVAQNHFFRWDPMHTSSQLVSISRCYCLFYINQKQRYRNLHLLHLGIFKSLGSSQMRLNGVRTKHASHDQSIKLLNDWIVKVPVDMREFLQILSLVKGISQLHEFTFEPFPCMVFYTTKICYLSRLSLKLLLVSFIWWYRIVFKFSIQFPLFISCTSRNMITSPAGHNTITIFKCIAYMFSCAGPTMTASFTFAELGLVPTVMFCRYYSWIFITYNCHWRMTLVMFCKCMQQLWVWEKKPKRDIVLGVH